MTLAFNLLVFLVLNNEVGLTEGSRLRALRSDMEVFGVDLFETRNYYYFCLVFLLAAIVLVWWIVRSPWGRAFKALRDNPARAASLGVDIRTYTLLAFSIGAGLAGVAEALYARLIEYVEPRAFYIGQSFDFFLATVVGGLGTMIGPFIGTSFITVLTDHLRFTGDYYRVWFGLFVIVMMLVAPKGVAGTFNQLRSWLQRRRAADATSRSEVPWRRGGAGHRRPQVVRWHQGRRRRVVRGPGRRDPRRHRPQRLRQDHPVQLHPRPVPPRPRSRGARRPGRQPLAAHRRANAGLARTFQLLQVFESMSVRDNLKTAAQEHIGSIGRRLFRTPDMGLGPKVDRLIERFRLGHLADEPAGNLSYGQQKLLDTAMAFVSDPAVVFLDEPAGGVNPTMLGEVRERIRDLNENDGTTFAVIEHNMEFVFGLAHRIVVMEQGRVLTTGTRTRSGTTPACSRCTSVAETMTPVADESSDGATATTTSSCTWRTSSPATARPPSSTGPPPGPPQRHQHHRAQRRRQVDRPQGDLRHAQGAIGQHPVRRRGPGRAHPGRAAAAGHQLRPPGPQHLPEDDGPGQPRARRGEPPRPVAHPPADGRDRLRPVPRAARKADAQAGNLSGGEQKMLEIGRAMLLEPRLLLVDEPSVGLSPILVRQVFALLRDLRDEGVTVLMVEQNAKQASRPATTAWSSSRDASRSQAAPPRCSSIPRSAACSSAERCVADG